MSQLSIYSLPCEAGSFFSQFHVLAGEKLVRAVWGKQRRRTEMKMKEDTLGEEEKSAGQGPPWTTVGFMGSLEHLGGPMGHLLPTTRGLS